MATGYVATSHAAYGPADACAACAFKEPALAAAEPIDRASLRAAQCATPKAADHCRRPRCHSPAG